MDEAGAFNKRYPWVGWAVFLGMSWTWVIGMYLPVLMVRDYGVWGWIVFAVPNVIGAAAMGWVLRRSGQSERLVAEHSVACRAFSLVTIAFHVFFTIWFLRQLPPVNLGIAGALVAAALVGWVLVSWRRGDLLAAAGTFVVSAVVIIVAAMYDLVPHVVEPSIRNGRDLLWLSPVVVFGFALCPYLDLTFHRARQALTPGRARAAFSVGFGTFFLLMIIFTLGYSWIARAPLAGMPAMLLLAHMSVQIGFTAAVHLRELGKAYVAVAGAVLLGVIAAAVPILESTLRGLSAGEMVYRLFMGFYGLVFPAYVLLCMIPARRRSIGLFWLATVLAAPFYWMGFIEQQTQWLLPGIGILIASRLLLQWPERKLPAPLDAPG